MLPQDEEGYISDVREEPKSISLEVEQRRSPSWQSDKNGISWVTASLIQLGDIVGVGILTMGAAFAELGFILAIFMILVLGIVNIYTGVLLTRSRRIFPSSTSYGDMAGQLWSKWAVNATEFFVYVFILFAMGSFFLALSQTLAVVFYGVASCQPLWGLLAMVMLLLICQFRTFGHASLLFWANSVFITLSLTIMVVVLFIQMPPEDKIEISIGVPPGMDWISFFTGISKLIYAFLAQFVYLEIMKSMREPKDFTKALCYIAGPTQIFLYVFVGSVAYRYAGVNATDSILKEIDPNTKGPLLATAAACLALHLLVAFLISGLVLHRRIHLTVHPSTVDERSWKGAIVWFLISFSTIIFSYLVSNSIVFFSAIVDLLGGLFGPILGFIFPIAFFFETQKKSGQRVHILETFVLYAILLVAFMILVGGTAANCIALGSEFTASQTRPFQCTFKSYASTF